MSSRTLNIIHLSDLHFGRIQGQVLTDLETYLENEKNNLNLVIITGDLTQRAKKEQFLAAKDFLMKIKCPLFIVPGNHDVPLYNLFLRFFRPYKKFLRHLGPFATNYYENEHVAIYGLWTLDRFTVKDARISSTDLKQIEEKFAKVPADKIKLIASHHPLPKLKNFDRLLKLCPHFLLWGHEHQSSVQPLSKEREFPYIMAAGTSTSNRTRKEVNSFNVMRIDGSEVLIEIMGHADESGAFETLQSFKINVERESNPPLHMKP